MRYKFLILTLSVILMLGLVASGAPALADSSEEVALVEARTALSAAMAEFQTSGTADAASAAQAARDRYIKAAATYQASLAAEVGRIEARLSQTTAGDRDALKKALKLDPENLALQKGLKSLAVDAVSEIPPMWPEVEPNNSRAQATPLLFSSQYTAIAHGAIRQGGELDVFSFVAPAGAKLWAYTDTGGTLNPNSNYRDTVLTLQDSSGTTLERDDDDGTGTGCDGTAETDLASVISGRTLAAGGTYYLSVRAFSPVRSIDAYRLYLHLTTVAGAEVEVNNTVGQATPVNTVTHYASSLSGPGDADFFSVQTLGAGNILFITLDGDPERDGVSTNVKLDVFDTDGSTLLVSVNSAGPPVAPEPQGEGVCLRVYKSGTFYARVTSAAGGSGTYSFAAVTLDGFSEALRSKPAVYNQGTWGFRTSLTTGSAEFGLNFGSNTDTPLLCDWDGNGSRTLGLFNNGVWSLRTSLTTGIPDQAFTFGQAGDIPVCGDWNGDGTETIGVFRAGEWLIRNSNGSGVADLNFTYGQAGDRPVVGDWNGDGTDTVGLQRGNSWLLRDTNTGGNPTVSFLFGINSDIGVVGDWDGDGDDTAGVYRNGSWFFRNTLTSGVGDGSFVFGAAGEIPLLWR